MSLAAIKAADLTIVPVRPTTFDVWAGEVTGRKLKLMDKEFVFLLNQCPPVPKDFHLRDAGASLEATGPVLLPYIRARSVFLQAARSGRRRRRKCGRFGSLSSAGCHYGELRDCDRQEWKTLPTRLAFAGALHRLPSNVSRARRKPGTETRIGTLPKLGSTESGIFGPSPRM
jgi:hypothetical protein